MGQIFIQLIYRCINCLDSYRCKLKQWSTIWLYPVNLKLFMPTNCSCFRLCSMYLIFVVNLKCQVGSLFSLTGGCRYLGCFLTFQFQFQKKLTKKIIWLIMYFIYNVSLFASSGVCEKINFTVSKLQKFLI